MRIALFALSLMSPLALADSPPAAAPAQTAAAATPSQVAPAGVEVYLISPKDGDTVSGSVVVRFGLKGMGVAPAGVQLPNTGHHHLLVDADALPAQNQPIAKDDHHLHFGGGQTETTLTLAPGKHTLQLVVGDYLHVPHNPPIASAKITITVK